jgi:hypothetical protein
MDPFRRVSPHNIGDVITPVRKIPSGNRTIAGLQPAAAGA